MKNQKPRSNIKAPAEYHLFVQLGFPKKGVLGNRLLSGTLTCGQLLFHTAYISLYFRPLH